MWAVSDYLNGIPLLDILNKYDISADPSLYKWIKFYNIHRKFKNSGGKIQTMVYRKNWNN